MRKEEREGLMMTMKARCVCIVHVQVKQPFCGLSYVWKDTVLVYLRPMSGSVQRGAVLLF